MNSGTHHHNNNFNLLLYHLLDAYSTIGASWVHHDATRGLLALAAYSTIGAGFTMMQQTDRSLSTPRISAHQFAIL
jgi:hypothetical protein